MVKKILIVGAGPGGCMTANRLAKLAKNEIKQGQLEVNLLSASPHHVYEAGYLFVSLNLKNPEQFVREQDDLLDSSVNLVLDSAHTIDCRNKNVTGKSGNKYPYDFLLIATGSEIRADITPGLQEGGTDFYSLKGAEHLKDRIMSFQEGKILCSVEVPHKCPIGFLEIMFLLHDYYRKKGIRDKIDLAFTCPMEGVHQKPEVARFCQPILDERGIGYHTEFTVNRVDPHSRCVYSKEGKELKYDLLITIPAHRGAKVIFESELGDTEGWIDTDPKTLKMNGVEHVYVIGDATNLHKKGLPKAGSATHYQSEVVAKNIYQELNGLKPNTFYDGKVFCFMETALERATYIQFDYETPASPPPSSLPLHWFKLSFNEMYWSAVRGIF